MEENKLKTKPYNDRRVLTRKIIRNKIKFELRNNNYPKVNKNFKSYISKLDREKLLALIDN